MKCRICNSQNLQLALDFGSQPWANNFIKKEDIGKEKYYPLRVVFCEDCKTAQLDYTVPKETMFGDHTYLSGITKTLNNHFKDIAQEVDDRFWGEIENKNVLDIGSNDGTQLKHFKKLGYDVLGVEASKTVAKIANDTDIPTLNNYFNLETAKKINNKFNVINAAGVFFHLEELHSVVEGVRECLKNEGVFIVQFLYIKSIVENMAFDQIYHEHLLYYSLKTIETLLNMHGLYMFDAYLSPIHGGSIIGFVSHNTRRCSSNRLKRLKTEEILQKSNELNTYIKFGNDIKEMKKKNLDYLINKKKERKMIYGFGAPVKGNTLLNYFDIGTEYIDCLVEKNIMRRGLYSPGKHIPIRIEDEMDILPNIYYVLAWNYKKEILANNAHLLKRGIEFYFPVNPKEIKP